MEALGALLASSWRLWGSCWVSFWAPPGALLLKVLYCCAFSSKIITSLGLAEKKPQQCSHTEVLDEFRRQNHVKYESAALAALQGHFGLVKYVFLPRRPSKNLGLAAKSDQQLQPTRWISRVPPREPRILRVGNASPNWCFVFGGRELDLLPPAAKLTYYSVFSLRERAGARKIQCFSACSLQKMRFG